MIEIVTNERLLNWNIFYQFGFLRRFLLLFKSVFLLLLVRAPTHKIADRQKKERNNKI